MNTRLEKKMKKGPLFLGAALTLTLVVLTACTAPTVAAPTVTEKPSANADVNSSSAAMEATVAFAKSGKKASKRFKVAYLPECATDLYCQPRWKAAQKAAADFGLDITLFDPNYVADTQVKQVQDAVLQNFDGYVLSPVTDATGCYALKLLQATGKPVATINSPMCGNADFTKGTVGFVGIQTVSYFTDIFENGLKSCDPHCRVVLAGGYLGSDLYNRWVDGFKAAKAKYPAVQLVSERPANFSPDVALTVVRDALTVDRTVNMVFVSSDPATFGAEQAIRDAGLKPGKDVAIYSVGGTADGLKKVKEGAWNSTAVLLPRDEGYYGVSQLAEKLITGKDTPGFANLAYSPAVVDGPGSPFITAKNADLFSPQW